jgi:hypothetical protein
MKGPGVHGQPHVDQFVATRRGWACFCRRPKEKNRVWILSLNSRHLDWHPAIQALGSAIKKTLRESMSPSTFSAI